VYSPKEFSFIPFFYSVYLGFVPLTI